MSSMRSVTAIAVISATLIAIGVALGASMSGGASDRIDSFEQIIFVRNVEHGQRALLGNCPLEREIRIERTGETRISWYVQMPGDHGCVRAADFALDFDGEENWDEPKVARVELALSPTDIHRLIDDLERLSWKIEWTAPENQGGTYSIDCARTTFTFPDRELAVTKSGTRIATLSVYGEKARGNASCIANEKANKAGLDTAFASFSPLLPSKYDLRPEVARRLYRK